MKELSKINVPMILSIPPAGGTMHAEVGAHIIMTAAAVFIIGI
jgi:hypothetical protein